MVEFEKGHKPSLNAFWEPFSALKHNFLMIPILNLKRNQFLTNLIAMREC